MAAKSPRRRRLVLTGLLFLTAIPVIAGAARIGELSTGARVTEENARFFHSPVPVVVHIVGATLFCLLGAFQVTKVRRWHRITGRLLVPAGLAAALSGLWMTLAYDLPEFDGPLLNAFRLLSGTAMAVSLVLGYSYARRRRFREHQAWMLRGYAIGMGAGTGVHRRAVRGGARAAAGGVLRAFAMAAGWGINLLVVQWYLHRTGVSGNEGDRAGEVRRTRHAAA